MKNHKILPVFNPFDRSLIQEIPMQGKEELEKALETAYRLFTDRKSWLPPHARIDVLGKLETLMREKAEELTILASTEGGKPYMDSKVEIHRAINGVRIAAEEIGRLKGTQIPMGLTASSTGRLAFTMHEPIGVVAAISAFNHPLNLIVHQVVTAFAPGCPAIVKPAGTTPMTCLRFVELMQDAGVPTGWVQALILDNEDAEILATDKRVSYLSFIGSAKVGWHLKSKLSPGTRCALEHGGAAPVFVDQDVALEKVVPALAKGGFYHAGQVCVSVQRVFAHHSIARKLAMQLSEAAQKLKVGNPLDPTTEVGPLILPKEADRIHNWIQGAIEEGSELLCGGNKIGKTCYAPTVLWNPSDKSKVSQEEIFGPVVCVYSYEDLDVAIAAANAIPYHFQAAVFSRNLDTALYCVQNLQASAVMVNDHTAFRVDWMPFGGWDASGEGVGGIGYTMREMTREKLMVMKSEVF
ncbi:aldehyde dehydrogenase family protein [Mariniradius sediminis]|uniref:Aldehyde dehydrogenase family protein n=1 Tax=Mariniradius sediminis TaxID=2909237 RepID=A0ABS9BWR4_9BACT|nr:aldehyde dehydrogenase family protein [Mariniradius sediminis]MCF1752167.1 aldehyde dehydrogenase family protein [Mariniradius sediminis]